MGLRAVNFCQPSVNFCQLVFQSTAPNTPWSQAVNISAVKPSKPTVTSSASLGFFDRRRLGLSFRSPGPVLPRTAARKARNRDPGALPGHVCGGPPSSVHPSAASCLRSAFRTQRSARGFRRRFRRLGFGCPRKSSHSSLGHKEAAVAMAKTEFEAALKLRQVSASNRHSLKPY